MMTLEQSYRFAAKKVVVWRVLVDPAEIAKWSGSEATMSEEPNAPFSLWDGSVRGKNKLVDAHKRLIQEWYGGDWPEPSQVTISLEDDGEGTAVTLLHEGIPDADYEDIVMGWKAYVFEPIKHYLNGQIELPDVEYHQGG